MRGADRPYTAAMFGTAFTWWGTAVTWLEVIACLLAFACVVCNILENPWGWPLAIVSSGLYAWLFAPHRIYGDAGLQVFFALTSLWGWWQWLFGRRAGAGPGERLRVVRLAPRQMLVLALAWLALWLGLGLVLTRLTDSDVPWLDAFPTAGSLLGQVLLGRKVLENWLVWMLVNVSSIALFTHKQLWLTALLYALFIGTALIGWLRWRAVWRAGRGPS